MTSLVDEDEVRMRYRERAVFLFFSNFLDRAVSLSLSLL